MTALPVLDTHTAPEASAQLLRVVGARFGSVPNLARVMANSPALLHGYLELDTALHHGVLDVPTREQIALTVAETNGCAYCLSAHAYFAEHAANLTAADIAAARAGTSADPRTAAVLTFAQAVTRGRGELADAEMAAARRAGLTDQELAEIVGHVGVNTLTNIFAKTARVPLDFPLLAPDDDVA